MARRALGPALLTLVSAVERSWPGPALIACSGGADSLALAAAVQVVGARRGDPVRAAVVDHGLQAESDAVARRARDTLDRIGVPAVILSITVPENGRGPEAAAREARYAALRGHRRAGETVMVGHTMDDQAESVLLGLARGSGTRSLAGMPRGSGDGVLLRPLLGVRAATCRAACDELGITWWEDPHNASERFARVRVRRQVMPVLEEALGPGMVEALARTAELASADADLLDVLAAAHGNDRPELSCAELAELPQALRARVVRDWLRHNAVRDVAAVHVHAVVELVLDWHGQQGVDVPGGQVRRVAGMLSIHPASGVNRR